MWCLIYQHVDFLANMIMALLTPLISICSKMFICYGSNFSWFKNFKTRLWQWLWDKGESNLNWFGNVKTKHKFEPHHYMYKVHASITTGGSMVTCPVEKRRLWCRTKERMAAFLCVKVKANQEILFLQSGQFEFTIFSFLYKFSLTPITSGEYFTNGNTWQFLF